MNDLPIISECSGDMEITQALQHFMVNSNKTMVIQNNLGERKPSAPLAPHQIAALKHSFGGNMKIPDNAEQFTENIVDCDEHGVSSSTPLAPHQIAALKHSFGGHFKFDAIDIDQWKENSKAENDNEVSSTTGHRLNKENFATSPISKGYWKPGAYPVSGPSAGLSRESSRDDLTSVEGHTFEHEERFRVDRRKLEMMMIGRFDPVKEEASDFFQRIGEQTNTTIIWPSRLKIGAKSKKDPHIRVGGDHNGVKQAKALIMEFLDTKTNRVTMKMDVSYTDHSHVIGKGGNTIRRVMSETGCHIHFPDSNRSNPSEKSNQVSIAGEIEGVEKARARVRELTPLVFTFDMPLVSNVEPSPDPSDPYLRAIQDQYNIQIMFRQKQKNYPTTLVVVKGCQWEAARVKEATMLLVDHFCGGLLYSPSATSGGGGPNIDINQAQKFGKEKKQNLFSGISHLPFNGPMTKQFFPISMTMEISPIHHSVVLGKGNATLRTIMQRTNTTILFPDAGDVNIPSIRKGSVTISGTIHNVYFARQQLLGSLPLVMMFEMPENMEMLDDIGIQKIQEKLDVNISIKPKQRQANKSVLIKAQERNASNIYKARHILLGLEDDLIEAEIPDTYIIRFGPNNENTGNGKSTNAGIPANTNYMTSYQIFNAPSTQSQLCTPNIKRNSHFMHQDYNLALPPPIPSYMNYLPTTSQGYRASGNSFGSIDIQSSCSHSNTYTSAYNSGNMSTSYLRPPQNNSNSIHPPFNDPTMIHRLIKNQAGAFLRPPVANQIPSYRPIQQRLENIAIQQNMHRDETIHNNRIPSEIFGNALPPNHPVLQDYALLVLNNITRLQQQQDQYQMGSPQNDKFEGNNTKNSDVNDLAQHLKELSTNSEEQDSEHCRNCKSRLQMRAPPPLSALPSANLSNASFSGSSILSPGSSQLGGSANENVTRNNTWLAFDDDLPSLLAKQKLNKY